MASPEAIIRGVVEDVIRHAAGAPQSDDITAMAIRYRSAITPFAS